jgi:hypothetical protein
VAALALVAISFVGCEDRRSASHAAVECSDRAPAAFLASKFDDDDGDGNPFDEDYPVVDDEDDDIADHAWIRDASGNYHLFFHNEGHGAPSHIEHYVSTDLDRLDYVGIALEPVADAWDADGLWAPYVVEVGTTYYMFYTGIQGGGANAVQRIGVAVSRDLSTWTRPPLNRCSGTSGDGCVYECRECWTTGGGGGSFDDQCRDPFVIRDDDAGRWLLFATAKSTNGFGVVTVAASTDLIRWRGVGFVDATRRLSTGTGGQSTGGQAENPFVMTHGGVRYLLFTDWWDPEDDEGVADPRTIAQYATSATLAVDTLGSANWSYRGYIPDPGVNAIEVQRIGGHAIMSQSIAYPSSSDYPDHRRSLRLKCVIGGPGYAFDTSNAKPPRHRSAGAVTRLVQPTNGIPISEAPSSASGRNRPR